MAPRCATAGWSASPTADAGVAPPHRPHRALHRPAAGAPSPDRPRSVAGFGVRRRGRRRRRGARPPARPYRGPYARARRACRGERPDPAATGARTPSQRAHIAVASTVSASAPRREHGDECVLCGRAATGARGAPVDAPPGAGPRHRHLVDSGGIGHAILRAVRGAQLCDLQAVGELLR